MPVKPLGVGAAVEQLPPLTTFALFELLKPVPVSCNTQEAVK
jgi:hypothetical protein